MSLDRNVLPPVRDFDSLTLPSVLLTQVAPHVVLHVVPGCLASKIRVDIMYGRPNGRLSDPVRKAAAEVARALAGESDATHTSAEVADTLDFEGARLTTASYSNSFGITVDCLPQSLERITALLVSLLASPQVSPESLQARINAFVQKRRYDEARIMFAASEHAHRLAAGLAHPYLFPITADSYGRVTGDVVDSILTENVRHSEIHIYAAGGIDARAERTLLDFGQALAALQGDMLPEPPAVKGDPEAAGHVHLDSADTLQTAVSIAIPVPVDRFHPDYPALRLAVMALGGYFGSRLMTNIREEKGLTYGINAALECVPEFASVMISAQCGAGTAALTLGEIRNEIDRLATVPVPDDEVRRLRRFASTQLATTLDTPYSILAHYQMAAHLGIPDDYFDRQFRAIRALDGATINRMTERYVKPAEMRIVTSGSPI